MTGSQRAGAAAFLWACTLDVTVRKPGNVSVESPGRNKDAALFIASAKAAAAPLFMPGASVGERIEAAVLATRDVAARNPNLGIILLCAPLARALETCASPCPAPAFQDATLRVLEALDRDDARAAFRAIARARPGGLGAATREDVHGEPTMGLREAMALAAGRDRIAAQFASGYEDVFGDALALFFTHAGKSGPGPAMQAVFLRLLAQAPDSHIVREHGLAAAQTVMQQARSDRALALDPALRDYAVRLAAWDLTLKESGLNPGTSADLAVATAFVAGCIDPSLILQAASGRVHG